MEPVIPCWSLGGANVAYLDKDTIAKQKGEDKTARGRSRERKCGFSTHGALNSHLFPVFPYGQQTAQREREKKKKR